MNVGNFPIVMISTLMLFLPAEWVREFVARVEERLRPRLAPRLIAAAAGTAQVAALAFSSALPSYLAQYRPQGELARVLDFVSLDQRWDMVSPDPARPTDGCSRPPSSPTAARTIS